jgi:RNA polymerase sigma factor (sigma-70 family)
VAADRVPEYVSARAPRAAGWCRQTLLVPDPPPTRSYLLPEAHNRGLGVQVEMVDNKKTLLERLFADHGGSLQAFLYKRVRRRPDAVDLAQEVYVRMLRVPDLDAIRNPESYLFTVASNLAKEHARLERRDCGALDVDDPLVEAQLAELPAFGGELDRAVRIRRLREVLQQLPPKCHAAVVLQYWHGMSYEEIAQRLGVSTHMVKKYLSQALLHCRRRMARLG